MEAKLRILVELLAETDALFIPVRKWHHKIAATFQLREAFCADGLPARADTADETEQRAHRRALDTLAAEGLVERIRNRGEGTKTVGVRLTDRGDQWARAACGVSNIDAGIASVVEVHRLRDDPRAADHLGRVWIPETLLARREWGQRGSEKEFVLVEELMLPALVRGWVVSNASVQGHVWYALTPAGVEVAESDTGEDRPLPADLPKPERGAARLYDELVKAALNRLAETTPPSKRSIGEIPLPTSIPPRGNAGGPGR